MHELNMDKKKKNEDNEVIDFMELVEENLNSVNNEAINSMSEDFNSMNTDVNSMNTEVNEELLENKPLQSTADSSSEISEGLTEEVLKVISDKEIGDELNVLNSRIEKMAMEALNEPVHEDLNDNIEPLHDDIEPLHDDIEQVSKTPKIHFKNSTPPQTPSQLTQTPSENLSPTPLSSSDRSLILRKSEDLESLPDHRVKKYPGFLYIDIYSIEKYISSDTDVQSVFIKMESPDFQFETLDFSEDCNIKMNSLTSIKISTSNTFNIRFILNKRTNTNIIKSSECLVKIDKDFLNKVHNTLFEINYEWSPYTSNNMWKSFISFFTHEMADAWGLKLFFSYVSEEEFKLIQYPLPSSLYELGKWLKIRKYAYNTWFTGFCNIRGFNTHLWKRRFIKVNGYKVFIYNEHTKNLLGVFDLLSTMNKDREIIEEDYKFKIINKEKMIEFHFESNEKYYQFRKVMEALL